MASTRVPTTLPPEGPPPPIPAGTTDVNQGDYLVEIAGATAISTLIGLFNIGGLGYLGWLADIVLVPLVLARSWQRLKWSSVVVPSSGYLAFVKGRYLSGHTKLTEPEDAVLGLTNDSLCVSTVGGDLQSIHLLQIVDVSRHTESRSAWGKSLIGGCLLLWVSPALFLARLILGGTAKDEVYILDVAYKRSSGMSGNLRFLVDNQGKADEIINRILATVDNLHDQVRRAERPTPA